MSSLLDALLTLVGTTLLIGSASLLGACLRLRSTISYLLTVYLGANLIVVVTTLGLSPWHLLQRWTLLFLLVVVFAASLTAWWRLGRPTPPWRPALATARICLRDRVLGPFAVAVGLGFAYVVAIAVLTPENEGDALAYHVARAAFWKQQQAVEYIPNAIETRLNVNPPNNEIAQLFTMLLSNSDRFVGLVQVAALVACMVGIVGIARRIGLSSRESMFGGLLFCTLPVVVTQAWTALNDLTVAAFLVIAVYFILERSRLDVVLAGAGVGLALGTKFTAALGLPLIVAVVLASPRPGKLKALTGMLLIGFFGSYWYLVNLRETGALDGGLAKAADQYASHAPGDVADTVTRLVLGLLELPGAPVSGWQWYNLPIVVVALVGALLLREHRSLGPTLLAGILVIAAPVVVAGLYRLLWETGVDGSLPSTPTNLPGATPSWFGPLGALLSVAGVVIAYRQMRRSTFQVIAVLLAAMPLLFIALLAVEITWDPWRGRFFIFPFALAASTWGLVLRYRGPTIAALGIAVTTMVLALANSQSKPSGLDVLSSTAAPSVWGKPRWWGQTILRATEDDRAVLRFAETIPGDVPVALAPSGNGFLSPYFGPKLTRRVELVLDGGPVSDSVDWIVMAPGVRPWVCADVWQQRFSTPSGWLISERVGGPSACTPP